MMREYSLATEFREYNLATEFELKDGVDPATVAIAVDRVAVHVVCQHFAIRRAPTFHPAGEGMMMESYTLDHMASGRRVYSGPFGGASYEDCEQVARSLSNAPIDWSKEDPTKDDAKLNEFCAAVIAAAGKGESLTWDEWRVHKLTGEGDAHEDDAALVRRAVASAGHGHSLRVPHWSHVARVFALGSTESALLCARLGFDPGALRGGCDVCGYNLELHDGELYCGCDDARFSTGEGDG